MAIDKKLQIFDDEGNPVDYDILASDVKFNDGKDLPTKLDEMEDEIGEGGYTPPPGGIPKTDLAPAVQQTLDNVANKVDKVTGYGLSKNDYTDTDKAKVDNLKPVATSGSYNDLTDKPTIPTVPTMDSMPTAGNTTHMVSSDGVAAAIAGKANAADVPTKTEMADAIDDALGDAQVTVVPENSVGIINSLGSDSDSDALSAAMGKKLKVAVLTILNSLGNYAFPGGKPTIDWGDSSTITYGVTYPDTTTTKVTHGNAPDTVNLGDMLEVTLGTNDDLYVINDDSVKVYMNNVEQIGAYDSATQKVTIAAVIGTVVIVANTMTYVGYGENNSPLVLMFDGKNQGETAGQWKDIANTSRSVALTGGYTKNSDNVQFDGTGYGSGNFVDDVVYNQSTVECVINQSNKTTPSSQAILLSGKTGAPTLALFPSGNDIKWATHVRAASDTYTASRAVYNWTGALSTKYSVSYYGNTMLQNGQKLTAASASSTFEGAFNVNNHKDKTFVGAQITGANAVLGFNGKIYCVRMYSRVLTDAEALQNWKVDQKRFNIS